MAKRIGRAGRALALLLALGITGTAALAQDKAAYPTRAVRLVVGFAAGGGNDILARILGERLAKAFGQPFIVENKPGAGGGLAASYVGREAPDGYTLLIGASGAMSIAPAVYTRLNYSTAEDFTAISLLGTYPLVLLVNSRSPHMTLADFVAWTKANASTANYSTSSPSFTLATELLKMKTGADMQRVAYRSSNDAVMAVLSGQAVASLVDTLPGFALVQDGQLRALATTAPARLPEMPDTPTMKEAGIDGLEVTLWTGLFGPARMPPEIVARLENETSKIMADPDVRQKLKALATDAVGSSAADFQQRIAIDIANWTAVAKAADVKIDP